MIAAIVADANRQHRCLIIVYLLGICVSLAVAWFPSFLCRAGSGVLLIAFAHMIWQRQSALRKGPIAQLRLRRSALYYVPFLAGANLVWMGLPAPIQPMAKAWSNCAFLAGSVLLLAGAYLYNLRTIRRTNETGSFH